MDTGETVKHTIAMSGATGFVGSHLSRALSRKSSEIIPVGKKDFASDKLSGKIQGADSIINLAGAPVMNRWTEEYKKIMYKSRIDVTKSLVNAMSETDPKPRLFISTSAIGYYASGGPHTEDDYIQADDFLGHLAQDWEREALRAADLGIRTVIFRFGVVLGKGGGALKQMITPFRLGLGGTIGDGSHPFSWIHIQDLIAAYQQVIDDESYKGVYNLTAPTPSTNRGLTKALSRALGRPALLRIPPFILRLKLGEGAQVLTKGQEVIPARLLRSGFAFSFADIDQAVQDCIS